MISIQTMEKTRETVEKFHLEYYVLSDLGAKVATQYNLVYTFPEIARPVYLGLGIDIPAHNGDDSYLLPIPAVFVLDKGGIIQWVHVAYDHTDLALPEEILAAVKTIKNL